MLRFKLHHLFAYSLFVTALCMRPVQAMGVSFELAAPNHQNITADNNLKEKTARINSSDKENQSTFKPLPIPQAAGNPPVRITQTTTSLPRNVIASVRVLPAPPLSALPTTRILPPLNIATNKKTRDRESRIGLSFSPAEVVAKVKPQPNATTGPITTSIPDWIYEGGANSLVARVVGSAEGTRAANGQPTRAYYGHTDPGNGVWNMGTFSYQHGANSPEEADNKQLKRLKRQGKALTDQAHQADLPMTLGEILNGLDLANQSPRAALDQGGYIDRLAQARQKGMSNDNAIVWARTYAYLDPKTRRWNAPGLGNTLSSITRDQQRRHDAVARAFNYYQAELPASQSEGTVSLTATTIAQNPISSSILNSPHSDRTLPERKVPKPDGATPVNFDFAEAVLNQDTETIQIDEGA
ncbi:MAG: hypothetical protein AAF959_02340 [Cyanobacteria bacterium P01_D01_bin.56]